MYESVNCNGSKYYQFLICTKMHYPINVINGISSWSRLDRYYCPLRHYMQTLSASLVLASGICRSLVFYFNLYMWHLSLNGELLLSTCKLVERQYRTFTHLPHITNKTWNTWIIINLIPIVLLVPRLSILVRLQNACLIWKQCNSHRVPPELFGCSDKSFDPRHCFRYCCPTAMKIA